MVEDIELIVKTNIYSPDKKLIKRNVIRKILVNIFDIRNPREILNKKGDIIKTACEITIKDFGDIVVNHSYDYIKSLKEEESKTEIGFKQNGKSIRKSNRNNKRLGY